MDPLAFFALLVVLVLPDLLAQGASRLLGLAWSEVFTILLPALVAAAGSSARVGAALGLGRPRAAPVLLGALLGAAGFLAANGVMALWVIVLPDRVLAWFPDVGRMFQAPPLARGVLVAVTVLLAPLCEEAAFRGFLQRALLRSLSPAAAIGLSALLFGIRHLDPVRLPALAFLGVVFGWASWRAGSLWPAVAAHAANNALAAGLVVAGAGAEGPPAPPTFLAALGPLLLGCAALAGICAAYGRLTPAPAVAPEPAPRDPAPEAGFDARRVPLPLVAAAGVGVLTLLLLIASAAL